MDESSRRPSFFRYKVLEDEDLLRRSSQACGGRRCRCCCAGGDCCPGCGDGAARCLNFTRFCVLFSTSLFLAMAPWAMALTEVAVMAALYLLAVHPGGGIPRPWHWHYSWWRTEQDVLALSAARAAASLVAFFLGLGRRLHRPYLVVSLAFAAAGLPFLAVKALMLRHPLASRWGLLPAACALFSLAHVVVATNVSLFARRRWEMGLLGPDEEAAAPAAALWAAADASEVPVEQLADPDSLFADCCGLRVHYKAALPEAERDPSCAVVLVHGFGGGAFAWRHVMQPLAQAAGCRVYAFDRPGFGLTERPPVDAVARPPRAANPYRREFQARLLLQLCQQWGCRRLVLVGHSDGCLVVLHAVALASSAAAEAPCPACSVSHKELTPAGEGVPVASLLAAAPSLEEPPQGSSPQQQQQQAQQPQAEAASSPFSKWLQLGQPQAPRQLAHAAPDGLQARLLAEEPPPPSLALGSASPAPPAQRHKPAAPPPATAGLPQPYGLGPGAGVAVRGVALLHPSFDGRVKPQLARMLATSRLGRSMLRRLLRTEVGEVGNARAWHDTGRLTPQVLRLYKAPLRAPGWGPALVEASRLRKEASPAELTAELAALSGRPVLLATGACDRLAGPPFVARLAERIGQSAQQGTIPACGHLSHEEAPHELLALLAAFLASLPAADV